MLIVRDIFYCKPGKVKPLVEMFKKMNQLSANMGLGSSKLMTDLAAERYWTVVSEWEVKSLQDFEDLMAKSMSNKELEQVMQGYHDFVEGGRREFYKIEA